MYAYRRSTEHVSGTIKSLALSGASALALLSTPGLAQAQSDSLAAAPSAVPANADTDTDIVVTARKREERLRDVPIAITAVGGGELQRKNIVQLFDLSVTVPTLQISNATTQPFTYLRGFGSGSNVGFEQSVGKFVDNVYFGRDQDGRIPIFDIERIEVLKGPQVIAFGNSATAGALNITTKKPGRSIEADGSVSYEFNQQEVQTQGGVTYPIADWASVRVAGMFSDLSRGQAENRLLNTHELTGRNYAVRPTLVLQPAAGLQVTLRYEYDNVRRLGTPVQPIAQPLRPGALLYPEVGDINRNDVDYTRAPVSSRDQTGFRGSAYVGDIRYDLAGGTLISTTAYRTENTLVQFGTDGPSHNPTYYQAGVQHYNQFSQELRFNGTYGRLDASVGGYYELDNLHVNQVQYFFLGGYGLTGLAATPIGRVSYFDQRTKKYSAFTDLTYRVTDHLSVSAGVRYSRSEKRAGQSIFGINIAPNLGFDTDRAYLDSYRSAAIDALLGPVLGTTPHAFAFGALKRDENFWQPQVIGQYKFGKNMFYVKYVKGDKAGGFDFLFAGSDPAAAGFKPEKAESFEAGLKGLALDNKFEYALTAFSTTFTSLQQSVFRDVSFVVSNVGKARSQGLEAEVTFRPVQGLRLGFNGAYLDAKFIDFPGAACGRLQNLATPRNCMQDLSGTPQPFASKWNAYASVDYEHPVGAGRYVIGGGASVFARTSFNADAYNDATLRQKGFAQLDAHLDLKPANGPWSLSVFARNLSDKRYLEFGILAPGQSTAAFGTYSRGRQIGARLSATFR